MTDTVGLLLTVLSLFLMVVFGVNQWKRRHPRTEELVRTRYMVVRSVERLPRLVAGGLDSIPLGGRQGMVSRSGPGFEVWSRLADAGLGGQGTPWDEVIVGHGELTADYLAEHPEIPNPGAGSYYGYPTRRGLRESDFEFASIAEHPLVRFLGTLGVPRSEMGHMVTYPEPGCEGEGYSLRFLPREIWFLMLVVEPLVDRGIVVESVSGRLRTDGDASSGLRVELALPPIASNDREAILVPLGALLPPLDLETVSLEPDWQDGAQADMLARWDKDTHWLGIVEPGLYQSIEHVRVLADRAAFSVIDHAVEPDNVVFRFGRRRRSLTPHGFEPSNVLALDTMWITGTCPHLFERRSDGSLSHIRELLPSGSLGLSEDWHMPTPGCGEIVIAELEFEVTYLERVEQAGAVLASEVVLRRGDSLSLPLRSIAPVRFVGRYQAQVEPTKPGGSRFKVAALARFLADQEALPGPELGESAALG